MRTVRISWKKLVLALAVCSAVIYFIGPSLLPASQPQRSHPGEKPVFLEDGSLGNFEKSEAARSGPGEMGKPHLVKPEQKSEEDRLKGRQCLLVQIKFCSCFLVWALICYAQSIFQNIGLFPNEINSSCFS